TAWYLLLTDIDDRKKAEEALQSSERNLRQVIDTIPAHIHVMSPNGSILYVNPPALEYTGLTQVEAQREDYRTRIFHPEHMVERVRAERLEAFSCPVPFEVEQRVLGKNGQYRWFLIRCNPLLDDKGRIDRWYSVAIDIDDRKKAEEALKSSERNLNQILNAIPTSVGVMRADGTPLYGNQAVTDYTGFTIEEMQKQEFRSRIFHPEDMERLRETRRLAFTRPVPFENEIRVLGKDGNYRAFLFRYKPLLDEVGKIDRWYMAALDIDDRKQAEAKVEQAYL